MELGLKNKVALVAASSRGLGKAIAWGLAFEGTKLVICARGKDVLEKTADDNLLTARACHKILRIARTIADINNHDITSILPCRNN